MDEPDVDDPCEGAGDDAAGLHAGKMAFGQLVKQHPNARDDEEGGYRDSRLLPWFVMSGGRHVRLFGLDETDFVEHVAASLAYGGMVGIRAELAVVPAARALLA